MVQDLGFFSELLTLSSEIFRYLVWISAKHFNNIVSSDQNICAITGDWSLSVKRCLITPGGLMIYPSAFINSVRRINSYFFSPYISKISFTIWRKAQSVNQSIGANQSIIVDTVRKAKKNSSGKKLCFLAHKLYSSGMSKLRRKIHYTLWKLEERFRFVFLFFLVVSVYFVLLYKRQNPWMTPLMPIRFVDQVIDGRKIVVKHFRVPIEQISNNMIYGVIGGEDQRFLEHRGVDFQALQKAFVYNVRHKSISLWWSTITQQTAKNIFLRPDRSLFRKGMEFYFALLMELWWSKERIMEVYLNIIEFWDWIYWVEQAAQYYFDKHAADLTQNQASFLVAMMPNPRYYQLHKRSYRLSSRKSIISRNINSMKRNKEIKTFVENTKD